MEISKPSCAAQTVFVVDDHPLIRDWLSRLINEEKDLKVCGWAETVDAATKAIEQLKPSIVIVDIALHGKSGLELIRLLTERNSPAPILVLSMHDEAIFAQRALKAGARGYVSKRETTERVVQAIRRILEGGMYTSDALAETLAAGLCDGKRKAHWFNNVSRLSDRELEVFRLLAAGRRTSEIAQDLTLSLKSIQTFCARIKEPRRKQRGILVLGRKYQMVEKDGDVMALVKIDAHLSNLLHAASGGVLDPKRLKNAKYKAPIDEYLTKNGYPFLENVKKGFFAGTNLK